jgi:hypothetical protein
MRKEGRKQLQVCGQKLGFRPTRTMISLFSVESQTARAGAAGAPGTNADRPAVSCIGGGEWSGNWRTSNCIIIIRMPASTPAITWCGALSVPNVVRLCFA